MPWKECRPMDERLRFIPRLLEGEKMAPLCREFGISRVTGYKIFNRYKECGLDALNDRGRRPYRQANKLPFQIERSILGIKREHPFWGAPIPAMCIHRQLGSTSHRLSPITRFTIAPSASLVVVESASTNARSISAPPSPAKRWASQRSLIRSVWSASCTMI